MIIVQTAQALVGIVSNKNHVREFVEDNSNKGLGEIKSSGKA